MLSIPELPSLIDGQAFFERLCLLRDLEDTGGITELRMMSQIKIWPVCQRLLALTKYELLLPPAPTPLQVGWSHRKSLG